MIFLPFAVVLCWLIWYCLIWEWSADERKRQDDERHFLECAKRAARRDDGQS